MPPVPGGPRARDVVLVLGVLVATVIALNLASALVPGMDAVLADVPLVIGGLVLGTLVVLVGVARRRS